MSFFKKKEKKNKENNVNEFEKDLLELLKRPDIKGKEDICRIEYEKASDLLEEPTNDKVKRALDIFVGLATQFEFTPAMVWLGSYYEEILQDLPNAAFWFKRAGDLGDASGARNFADMLITGNGIPRNDNEAIKYYKIASDNGSAEANYVLGEIYRTAGNASVASMYYKKAADAGYEPANTRLNQMNNPEEDIEETENASTYEDNFSDDEIELLDTKAFYNDCTQAFHEKAMSLGFANRGLIFIPELIPMGQKVVLDLLRDPFYQNQFRDNATQYYYFITALSLQTGIVLADKWHNNFDELKRGYVEKIMKKGAADDALVILNSKLNLSKDKANEFYGEIYDVWLEKHNPYWSLNDPRDYTFNAMMAAYQLGVSMILEKYGF